MKSMVGGAIVLLFSIMGGAPSAVAEPLTAHICKQKVYEAAELIAREGEASFAKIKDKTGPFVFGDGQGYVWVQLPEAIIVAHPIQPELEGRSLLDMRDATGKYIFVMFSDMALNNGEGWVPYTWPKPGATIASPKISFVKKINIHDKEYIIGSGLYDVKRDEIIQQFPEDKITEE